MRIIIILVFIFGFVSCKQDFDDYDISLEGMFYGLGDNIEKDCKDLKKSIRDKENNFQSLSNPLYIKYQNSTTEYLRYLEKLDSIWLKKQSNLFFDKENFTSEGKDFVTISENYVKSVNQIVSNEDLRDRINHLLGVGYVRTKDSMYMKYIDYYFDGAPKNTFRYLIKDRKRNVLLIQQEILYDILLEECK